MIECLKPVVNCASFPFNWNTFQLHYMINWEKTKEKKQMRLTFWKDRTFYQDKMNINILLSRIISGIRGKGNEK